MGGWKPDKFEWREAKDDFNALLRQRMPPGWQLGPIRCYRHQHSLTAVPPNAIVRVVPQRCPEYNMFELLTPIGGQVILISLNSGRDQFVALAEGWAVPEETEAAARILSVYPVINWDDITRRMGDGFIW